MTPPPPARAISAAAFATLLLIALMMGANHVSARIAFNHGADVATAVVFRSGVTATVLALILVAQKARPQFTARHRRMLPVIGLLIGVQSLCLYSSVARLPVALALLAFNTFPLWVALWSALLYRRRPERALVMAMPVILAGLALALDVAGAASGLGAGAQWERIGAGVGFALAAAGTFGLALVITQHEAADIDGRVRTAITMALAACVALAMVAAQGGFHLPTATATRRRKSKPWPKPAGNSSARHACKTRNRATWWPHSIHPLPKAPHEFHVPHHARRAPGPHQYPQRNPRRQAGDGR